MAVRLPKTAIVLALALLVALGVIAVLAVDRVVTHRGGGFTHAPEDAEWLLSEEARRLVDAAYADLGDGDPVVHDHWLHLLSFGQRAGEDFDNRSFVNRDFLSWRHPRKRVRAEIVLDAAGVQDRRRGDAEYLAWLLRQARALPVSHRLHIAALDQRYDRQGRPRPRETVAFVDNDYLWSLARRYPDRIEPIVSVHPYRKDAVAELTRWAERGVRAMAWVPPLQGIDPADESLADYYAALAEHDMTLYTHTGAVPGMDTEPGAAYGNPLLYRAALDAGVRVVMVHCAAAGRYPDPDNPETHVPGVELFLRLLNDPAYQDNLYGALAGITAADRESGALATLLQNPQFYDRLVYASGYPLPAIDAAVDVPQLAEDGFITRDQARALQEIYDVNPLLFDFVLKRLMRLPHTDLGLPPEAFTRPL